MALKRKKRKVVREASATPEPPKQHKQDRVDKPTSQEALIRWNGELVEALYASTVYVEIIQPLLSEGIASVTGRLTNGRYHHGSLTRPDEASPLEFQKGYAKGLMDFHNYLQDFVQAKDRLIQAKKSAEAEKKAPLYNPFMEEHDEKA